MEREYISRTIRTFGAVLLVFFPFGLYYLGFYPALAVLSGGVWGIVNLLLLSSLIKAVVRPGGVLMERAIVLGIIKFPLLYLSAYALLKVEQFDVKWLLGGFSGLFGVMLLKSLGRILLGLDNRPAGEEMRRAAS